MGNSKSTQELNEAQFQARWFNCSKSKCKKSCGIQLHKSGKVIFQKHVTPDIPCKCTNVTCRKHFRTEAKPIAELPDVCNANASGKKLDSIKNCVNKMPDDEVNLLAKSRNTNCSQNCVSNKQLNLLWRRSEEIRVSESADDLSQIESLPEKKKMSRCGKCYAKKQEYSQGSSLIHTSFMQTVFPNRNVTSSSKKYCPKYTCKSPICLRSFSGSPTSQLQQNKTSNKELHIKEVNSKDLDLMTLDKEMLVEPEKPSEDPKSTCGTCSNKTGNGRSESGSSSRIHGTVTKPTKEDSETIVSPKKSSSLSLSAPPTPSLNLIKKASNPRIFGDNLSKNNLNDLTENLNLLALSTENIVDSPPGDDRVSDDVEAVEEVVKATNIALTEAVIPKKYEDEGNDINANKSQTSTTETGSWRESTADIAVPDLLFPKETYQNLIMYENKTRKTSKHNCTSKPPRPNSSQTKRFQSLSKQQIQSLESKLDNEQCTAIIPYPNSDMQMLPLKKSSLSEVTYSQNNVEKIKITLDSNGKFKLSQKSHDVDSQNPLVITIREKEIVQRMEMEHTSKSNHDNLNGKTAYPINRPGISDKRDYKNYISTTPNIVENSQKFALSNPEYFVTKKELEEYQRTHPKFYVKNDAFPSLIIKEESSKERRMKKSQTFYKDSIQGGEFHSSFPEKYKANEEISVELSHVGRFKKRTGMAGYEIIPSEQFPPTWKYHPNGCKTNTVEKSDSEVREKDSQIIVADLPFCRNKNNSFDLLRPAREKITSESFSKPCRRYNGITDKQCHPYNFHESCSKITDGDIRSECSNFKYCHDGNGNLDNNNRFINLGKPLNMHTTHFEKSNKNEMNMNDPKLSHGFNCPVDNTCQYRGNHDYHNCEHVCRSQIPCNPQKLLKLQFFPYKDQKFANRTEIVDKVQQTIPFAHGESRDFSNRCENSDLSLHLTPSDGQKNNSDPTFFNDRANISTLSAKDVSSRHHTKHREGCKYAGPRSSHSGSSKSSYVPPYHKALAMFQRRTGERPWRRCRRRKGSSESLYGSRGRRRGRRSVLDVKSGPIAQQRYRSPNTARMNGINGHSDLNGSGGELISQNLPKGCWTIGLINSKFRYLTAETFGFKINANGASLKKKQIWTLEPSSPSGTESTIYLRSHLDKYLAVDSFGNVTCESEERDPGSKFQISVADDGTGRWALRNVTRGYFLGACADKLTCTAKVPGDAELWHVHLAARPQVNLRSVGRKRFAHLSENLDEIHVDANIPWGEDTLFTLEFRVDESGKYALHTCNNKYLSREGKLVDTCNPNCLFSAEYHSGQLALRDRQGAYLSPIGSKAVLKSRSQTVTKDELFSLEDSLPQASFVAALNGRYVSVKQGVDVTANQDEISDHETFQLEFDSSTKRWYIRTMQDRYWTLETGGGIQACGDKRSSNALFDLVWQGDGSVGFRANNGKFISTKRSGHLYANCDTVEDNAKYFFYLINRPILVLKCEQGFVGYKSATSPKLECNKATYETIQVERSEKGVVFFKGQNGKYWHVDGESVTADSDTPEGFFLELRDPTRICIKSVSGEYLVASKNGAFRLGDTDFENATKWEY